MLSAVQRVLSIQRNLFSQICAIRNSFYKVISFIPRQCPTNSIVMLGKNKHVRVHVTFGTHSLRHQSIVYQTFPTIRLSRSDGGECWNEMEITVSGCRWLLRVVRSWTQPSEDTSYSGGDWMPVVLALGLTGISVQDEAAIRHQRYMYE